MAIPATLEDFAAQALQAWIDARAGATAALADAATLRAGARDDLAAATADLDARRAELAAKRAELAAATVPANQEALVAEAAALQTQVRVLEAAVRDAADAAAVARARHAAALRYAGAAQAGLAAAEAEAGILAAEAGRLEALKAAATAPPLDTLDEDVDAALANPPYTTARAQLTTDLTAELVAAVRRAHELENARVAAYRASLEAAEDLLAASLADSEGHAAAVEGARLRVERAERRLRDWVDRGRERLARARAQLQFAAAGGALMTTAENAAFDAATEDGGPAAELRGARETARRTLLEAEVALDDAILAAQAPDPTADVSGVGAVLTATGTHGDADQAFTEAAGDYTPEAATYTAWAAHVSDTAWARVVAFLEAEAALNALDGMDPAALAGALTSAEEALAEALWNQHAGTLTAVFLAEQAAFRQARFGQARDARAGRLTGAVRGDT